MDFEMWARILAAAPGAGALVLLIFGFGKANQKLTDLSSKVGDHDVALATVAHLDTQVSNLSGDVERLASKVDKLDDLRVQVGRIDERTSGFAAQMTGMSGKLDMVFDRITART